MTAALYTTDQTASKAEAFSSSGGGVSSAHFETAFVVGQSSPLEISESSNYRDIGGFLAALITVGSPQAVDSSREVSLPDEYALGQNYPNPFSTGSGLSFGGNPGTTIKYQLPEPGVVVVKIYNVIGQEIKTLINGEKGAGYHTIRWNGLDDKGQKVPSGVYFYRLQVGQFVFVKKMLFVRHL